MVVLNWTCIGCGHVNYLSVESQAAILDKKMDPKYPARSEIIKCEKCHDQVSIQARASRP